MQKAQGTIEYLIIIAIVIVLALVVVGILINSAGQTSQVNATSSKVFWSSQPLAIIDSATDTNGNLIISLKNNTGEQNTITAITVNGTTIYPENLTISMGETKAIYLNKPSLGATTSNQISFTYTTPSGITKNQNTTTKLVTNQITTITPTSSTILLNQTNCFDWNGATGVIHPICTCDDLNTIDYNATTLGWSYSLQNNLDFRNCNSIYNTDPGWLPIGVDATHFFSGKFLGNNHTIKNLYIKRSLTDYVGLFGYISNATRDINDLGLINSNITGQNFVGGISGGYGRINNSYNTGTITGAVAVGGITGGNGTVNNSYNSGTVNGSNQQVGGINGQYGTVNNSYNSGTITSGQYTGGIIGYSGSITNSYNTGTVKGGSQTGGISGQYGTVTNSHNDGNINGTGNDMGGIIGVGGTVNYSYNTGTINGQGRSNVGGISGNGGTVNYSYNTGTINGTNWTGGIIGVGGTVISSYNAGTINGTSIYIGGISGGSTTVNNSYNTGTVTGVNSTGGITGYGGIVNNSYNTGTIKGGAVGNMGGINGASAIITNSFSTGSITGASNTYGIIGSGGTVINIHWYDSTSSDDATNCYPSGDANCTKYALPPDTNYTRLYDTNNSVYTTSPVWDGNWVWQTNAYPKLSWQP